jgi:hypothetical protein
VRRAALLLLALALAPFARADGDPPLAWLTFDRYYDPEAIGAALARIHAAYPDRTRLESMGKSREGRDLWVMSVFDPAAGDPDAKPAMYVDANTHGNEIQGGEVCLYTIKYLLVKEDPWVKDLLRHVTFHVAPCVNPDSRERYLHGAFDENSPRRVLRPFDDDRDGLVDEDGPNDIDGDGEILEMRIADPDGDWVVDERDDRLMRPRKPGERGQYRLLGEEGIDDDGDGKINEDPIGGVDPNRNWPANWATDDVQYGAGPYPLSEPETRATALWVLAHPRIAGVQSYHNAGRMILRPPGAWTDREADMPHGDKRLYDELGRRGLHVLPTYRYMQIREDLYRVFGSFVDWAYVDVGAFAFTNELWGRIGREVPGEDDPELAALRWNDVALHGNGFVRWHKAHHPQFGEIEIGGWRRFTVRTDPPDFLNETCVRNCLFTLEHAASLPRLEVDAPERADGGLAVRIENRGMLPTIHEMARRFGVLPPDRVRVVGGTVVAAVRERTGLPGEVLEVKGGAALLPDGIPGTSSVALRLVVEGTPTEVVVESRLGGVATARVK